MDTPAKPTQRESNVINVSVQYSPVFYSNLAKRFLQGGEKEVKLTGLGDATSTVVGAVEILKRTEGLAEVLKLETSLSDRGLPRIMVVVTKGPRFDELYIPPTKEEEKAAEKEGKEAADTEKNAEKAAKEAAPADEKIEKP